MRSYFRPRLSAIDATRLVLPTPGGPHRHIIDPFPLVVIGDCVGFVAFISIIYVPDSLLLTFLDVSFVDFKNLTAKNSNILFLTFYNPA